MVDAQNDQWNEFYSTSISETSDPWLFAYSDFFGAGGRVLDLGCGNGSNIPFLLALNTEVLAVDYSEVAINHIKEVWKVEALVHDMRNRLPFPAGYFDVVLADLSLHYFSFQETTRIVADLHRVTKDKGMLIARVNSVKDTNHGSGLGEEIERGYFHRGGRGKRYFDEKMVSDLFNAGFSVTRAVENRTDKYRREKVVWEIVAVKSTQSQGEPEGVGCHELNNAEFDGFLGVRKEDAET